MDPSSGFLSRIDLCRGINSAAELIWMRAAWFVGVFELIERGKHIPVKVDVSGAAAAGPMGGLTGPHAGLLAKKRGILFTLPRRTGRSEAFERSVGY